MTMHSTKVKTRLFITLSLFAVLFAACAPAATSIPVPAQQPAAIVSTATLLAPSVVPTLGQASQSAAGSTQELAPTPYPIATSRGPKLEATDPKTVSMASGGLQFVEFFEFW